MKLFLKIGGILFVLGLFTLVACKKSDSDTAVQNVEMSNRDALNAFAKLVVDDFRSEGTLKQQQIAMYEKTKNEQFNIVDLKSASIGQRTSVSIQELIVANPLMQIPYPSFAFQTNETFDQYIEGIQYYVVLDMETDLETATELPAYDSNGNATTISATFDETIKYAVIKMDEAHDAIEINATHTVKGAIVPASIEEFIPSRNEGTTKFYEEATIMNAEARDRGPVPIENATARGDGGDCPGNRVGKDYLHKIRFSDRDAVTKIENGFHLPKVELIATYIFATVAPGTTGAASLNQVVTQVDRHWKDLRKDLWQDLPALNQQIKTWEQLDSKVWKVAWVERDYKSETTESWSIGITPTYTVNKVWSFSGPLSYGIKKNKGDNLCGDIIVEYCDPSSGEGTQYKIYTAGNDGMYFRENAHN